MQQIWRELNGRRRALQEALAVAFAGSARLGFAATIMFPEIALCLSGFQRNTKIHLGDTTVELMITERDPPVVTFVSLHGNEQTAVAACRRLMDHFGGRLIELKAQGQRLVTFSLNGARYTFDPNRIFTDTGIQKSLKLYGAYSKSAHLAVAQLRDALLTSIRNSLRPPIVALHNNSDGALSVKSYQPGGTLHHEASRVAINPKFDPDNFFLVTDTDTYDRLQGVASMSFSKAEARPTMVPYRYSVSRVGFHMSTYNQNSASSPGSIKCLNF